MYLAVQVALREALVEVDAESVVRAARRTLGDSVTLAARAVGERVGLDVLEVVVKDVILPPELRSAYSELVTAKTRGQAQLEAARAETAALRSLANGAKLLDEHPALARLRLVQALPYGSTLELQLRRAVRVGARGACPSLRWRACPATSAARSSTRSAPGGCARTATQKRTAVTGRHYPRTKPPRANGS